MVGIQHKQQTALKTEYSRATHLSLAATHLHHHRTTSPHPTPPINLPHSLNNYPHPTLNPSPPPPQTAQKPTPLPISPLLTNPANNPPSQLTKQPPSNPPQRTPQTAQTPLQHPLLFSSQRNPPSTQRSGQNPPGPSDDEGVVETALAMLAC